MNQHLQKLLALFGTESTRPPFVLFYKRFQAILEKNNQIQEIMADMEEKLGGEYVFDGHYIEDIVERFGDLVFKLISDLTALTRRKHSDLFQAFERIQHSINAELAGRSLSQNGKLVVALESMDQDDYELAGEKMAGLANIRNRLMLPTADGFVITTCAFEAFMHKNNLQKKADIGTEYWRTGNEAGLRKIADEMQSDILRGSLPRRLKSQIFSQFDELAKRLGQPDLRVALRSSAKGENGESSFAGQYLTALNVPRDQLLDGYRKVIASCYGFGAWRYRLQKGYREHEIHMAVGCQVIIQGLVSGVLHTFAPHIGSGNMVINAAWGLCEQVVQGEQAADTIILDRRPPHHTISHKIAKKSRLLMVAEKSGTVLMETPSEQINVLSLTPDQMKELAQAAMSIERYYKRPQEIEWSYDAESNLKILQSRPLRFHGTRFSPGKQLQEDIRHAEIIFSNRGFTVQCGIGVGRVFAVQTDEDLDKFPHGAILLSRHSSPRYVTVMHKARGIITDRGSPTGHMATLAREYRVPTIVNTEIATQFLRDGDEITLDASQATVYRGYLYTLNSFELTEEEVFEDTYEFRLLRRLTRHVSRLNLINSHSEDFVPSACQTYHDIARYIHDKAVEEIIQISEKAKISNVLPPKRLESNIPLGLLVIDGGGGTQCPAGARVLTPDQIVSFPLRELLDGIMLLGMWCNNPVSVNLGSFMSSFTRTFCTTLAGPHEVGRNLAVALKNYVNIHLRLGYHFTYVDAHISEITEDNYIDFRFWGGVTEQVRRYRRAAFIAKVLEYYDFLVEIHGDLVTGRLKKEPRPRMSERMRMLGGLIGYTRQLDADMNADSDITGHTEIFIKAINRTCTGENDERK